MSGLLSVDDALERILKDFHLLSSEEISLGEARDRVLWSDIVSPLNIPAFANSSMDGFAVRAEDTIEAQAEKPLRVPISMDIPAGVFPEKPLPPGNVARIMTGAPLPVGANAVIPVEMTDAQWKSDALDPLPDYVGLKRSAKSGDNVRLAGEDIQVGQVVVKANTLLRAEEIGVLASIGKGRLQVYRRPVVCIVSTGDELVDLQGQPQPGQIYDSNGYALAALVQTYGGIPIRLPIARDTLDEVRASFLSALEQQPDIIVSSAGVSVGAFDVVRTVIDELGRVDFWKINVRPGKPLAYGRVREIPYFGLPGNPVSAMVTFDLFVRPAICKLGNRTLDVPTVVANTGEDIHSDGRRSYLRVYLSHKEGTYTAHLTGTQSSGALTSMVKADGLLIVPENVKFVPAGTQLSVRVLRAI